MDESLALPKREIIAALCLMAIASNPGQGMTPAGAAGTAVSYADALLRELAARPAGDLTEASHERAG